MSPLALNLRRTAQGVLLIGPDSFTLAVRQKDRAAEVLARTACNSHDSAAAAETLRATLARYVSTLPALDVVFTDRCARLLLVDPVPGLSDLNELHALAQQRLGAVFGIDSQAWLTQGDWRSAAPSLVAALPRARVDTTLSTLRALAVKVPAVQVYALHLWDEVCSTLPAYGIFCALAPESATVLLWRDTRIVSVRTLLSTTPSVAQEVHAWLLRETTRLIWPATTQPQPIYYSGLIAAQALTDTARFVWQRIGQPAQTTAGTEAGIAQLAAWSVSA